MSLYLNCTVVLYIMFAIQCHHYSSFELLQDLLSHVGMYFLPNGVSLYWLHQQNNVNLCCSSWLHFLTASSPASSFHHWPILSIESLKVTVWPAHLSTLEPCSVCHSNLEVGPILIASKWHTYFSTLCLPRSVHNDDTDLGTISIYLTVQCTTDESVSQSVPPLCHLHSPANMSVWP